MRRTKTKSDATRNSMLASKQAMICGLLVSGILNASSAMALERDQTGEFSINLNLLQSETFSGTNQSSLEVDSDLGIGFGYMYNVDSHWAFGGSVDWIGADYTANLSPQNPAEGKSTYRSKFDQINIDFDVAYYFMKGDITPFVNGSIGWSRIDTNIQNGPGYTQCWWDYWGYYCSEYIPTKHEDGLNYGIGLGVRWDINRHFSLKGGVNRSRIDIDVPKDAPEFTVWRFEVVSRI